MATYKVRVQIHQQIFEAEMWEEAMKDISLHGVNSNTVKVLQICPSYMLTMMKYSNPVGILSKEVITTENESSQPVELESEVCIIKLV